MRKILLFLSFMSLALFISCRNNQNIGSETFSFVEDTIVYQPGKITNLDLKFGFKNIKLNSKYDTYKFGKDWYKANGPKHFTLLSLRNPETTIGDLQIDGLLLTFYKNALISVDIVLKEDTLDSNTQFELSQRLALLLIEMFGPPNDLNFSYCFFSTNSFAFYTDSSYNFDSADSPKTFREVQPSFLYRLIKDTLGSYMLDNYMSAARWKSNTAILEYSLLHFDRKNNFSIGRFRFNVLNYDEIVLNYLVSVESRIRYQDSSENIKINSELNNMLQDSLSKEKEMAKKRLKGL